jgi:DNA-binding NarL/FixJ family response regulator
MSAAVLSVLLIEDSPLIRDSLVDAIEALGRYRVTAVAQTAGGALATLAVASFDAVIVDLQLRGEGSGIDVLAYLRRTGRIGAMLSVVLTNHALPAYRQRCLDYGVMHFFDKSLEFDRVIDVLDAYARERANAGESATR